MGLNEQSIRKQWLIAYIVWTVWGAVGIVLGLFVLTQSMPPDFPLSKAEIMILFGMALPVSMTLWWVTYRCCYQKRGTGWLLLLLVCCVPGVIVPPVSWLKGIPLALDCGIYSPFLEVVQWLADFCLGFVSYRLYKVNVVKKDVIAAKMTDAFNSWSEELALKSGADLTFREKLVVAKENVRKHWLVAYGIILVASLFTILPLLDQLVRYSPLDFEPELYQGMLSLLIVEVGFLWASWFFPYRRRGTKWLIFQLAITVVGELLLIASAYSGETSVPLLFGVLLVLTYVQGVLFCWLLVNRARQRC